MHKKNTLHTLTSLNWGTLKNISTPHPHEYKLGKTKKILQHLKSINYAATNRRKSNIHKKLKFKRVHLGVNTPNIILNNHMSKSAPMLQETKLRAYIVLSRKRCKINHISPKLASRAQTGNASMHKKSLYCQPT